MRVIFNDRVALQTRTGVGHYAAQLLRHVPRIAPADIELRPALSPYFRSRARKEVGASTVPGASRRPDWQRRLIQSAYRAFFNIRALGCNLYHEPNHIPIPCRVPTITTIHDLSVIEHPDWHPDDRRRWYDRDFDRGLRQSTRFIAASEFTKQRIIARYGIAADRIDVTYQAAREMFTPQSDEQLTQTRQRLAADAQLEIPDQFLLFVGTLEPRKNIPGLVDAFLALPAKIRRRCPLIIVGGWGWNINELRDKLTPHLSAPHEIRHIGYADDALLAGLFAAATALVWPTFYEGFGLPPLEAMACGTPVIASNITSIPEVVGDAGILLDPLDTPAWTASMQRMIEDPLWRDSYGRRGLARAGTFSWQRCAAQTVESYRKCLT